MDMPSAILQRIETVFYYSIIRMMEHLLVNHSIYIIWSVFHNLQVHTLWHMTKLQKSQVPPPSPTEAGGSSVPSFIQTQGDSNFQGPDQNYLSAALPPFRFDFIKIRVLVPV